MLIDCPACARSYHVSRDEIGVHGRTVVCPRCHEQWFVDGDGRAVDTDLTATAVSARVEPAAHDIAAVPRRSMMRALRPVVTIAAGIASLMLLIGARDHIVRAVPRLARLYAVAGLPVNVRGLEFAVVGAARSDASAPMMVLSGQIRNVAARRVAVPRLAFEVRDRDGAPLMAWSEAAPARMLGAGKALNFASQPHDIPVGAQAVVVRFQADDQVPPMRVARDDR